MDHPVSEPVGAQAYLAVCGHTHLFRGARCRIRGLADPGAFVTAPRPVDLVLRFADDVVADAGLRVDGPAGAVLVVAGYTTAAGTSLDGRSWSVRELRCEGDEVELIVAGPAASGREPTARWTDA
ncbi:hypothetical protein K377_06557 [Streptomyces sp. PsTaAH-137]|nr:hypothetical protein [Streptomyces sp. SID8367]RAJ75381.1 hypothetical protein K377_06557 [Streptomyces sp. PsTaAH-137]